MEQPAVPGDGNRGGLAADRIHEVQNDLIDRFESRRFLPADGALLSNGAGAQQSEAKKDSAWN
jgi:hypothetical protein